MKKSSVKPVLFSTRFNIPESELSRLGVFDPALNVDTLLFPDPLLVERSSHPEIQAARKSFDKYFETVMTLLHGIRSDGDKVYRTAFKMLSFPEIKGTCLGYGSASISGSGTGPVMTKRLIDSGRDIIRMGIDDPDLFMAMGLFEEDFGPDLIGDMFTNVAFEEISRFNKKIIDQLKIPSRIFEIKLKNGKKYTAEFAENLVVDEDDVPVILLPKDILRDLPIATSWGEVQSVAADNEEFRASLNQSVADLWSKKTLEGKDKLRAWALSSPSAFGSLLDMLHGHDGKPYDFLSDPHGEMLWKTIGKRIVEEFPFKITKEIEYNNDKFIETVKKIIDQFSFLIEKRDLWRELYTDVSYSKPRFEKSSQRLFYSIAMSYCDSNDLDISPEADTGRGPVDFKISKGKEKKILVELKLSSNSKVVHGYEKQLQKYNAAESPLQSYYVVIQVGYLGEKWDNLLKLRENQIKQHGSAPEIVLIDGLPKKSASKS